MSLIFQQSFSRNSVDQNTQKRSKKVKKGRKREILSERERKSQSKKMFEKRKGKKMQLIIKRKKYIYVISNLYFVLLYEGTR